MKRRKTLNKYRYSVGDNGEIKNNRPVLSERTKQFVSMMGLFNALSEIEKDVDEFIDTIEEDEVDETVVDRVHEEEVSHEGNDS